MNLAESRRDELILSMEDRNLLVKVLGTHRDEDINDAEYNAFLDMLKEVKEGRVLSLRQRSWVEEAARRVIPIDSKFVPRGREVPEPASLRRENLPLKPPSKRKLEDE